MPGKEYNVHLNFVPFIDLLSSITVFLLFSAVWNEYAQIDVEPQGLGRDAEEVLDEEEEITASVLLGEEVILAGLSTGQEHEIPTNEAGAHDWDEFEEVLSDFQEMGIFEERNDIELAADDRVEYQDVINAMDVAVRSGFDDVGFVDPASLTVQFHQ